LEHKMAIKVFPYKAGSRSAKALAEACGGRVLRRNGSKYRFREGDLVINWGGRDCPFKGRGVANQPNTIEPVANKLTAFQTFKEANVSIPPFWTKREDIPNDAFPIMCRTKLQAHSGEGIVVAEKRDELVAAPLYTKYIPKKHEYRVHALRKPGGEVKSIIVQRKAKKHDAEKVDFKVRNLANGFIYLIDDNTPKCVLDESFKALESTGLAFGAVDVIYNEHQNKAYILEVNTAPGLEERTAAAYARAFKEIA
jgi:glutathione synthase/RimK-type ligase-like ATP-grasp enzyme